MKLIRLVAFILVLLSIPSICFAQSIRRSAPDLKSDTESASSSIRKAIENTDTRSTENEDISRVTKSKESEVGELIIRGPFVTIPQRDFDFNLPDGSRLLGRSNTQEETTATINGTKYLIRNYAGNLEDRLTSFTVGDFAVSSVSVVGSETKSTFGVVNRLENRSYSVRATRNDNFLYTSRDPEIPVPHRGCGYETQGRAAHQYIGEECDNPNGCGSTGGGGGGGCRPDLASGRVDVIIGYTPEACVEESLRYYQETCDAGTCDENYNITNCTEDFHLEPLLATLQVQSVYANWIATNTQIDGLSFLIVGYEEINNPLPGTTWTEILEGTDGTGGDGWCDVDDSSIAPECCPLGLAEASNFVEELCIERRNMLADSFVIVVGSEQLDVCGASKGSMNGYLVGVPARSGIAVSVTRRDCFSHPIIVHELVHQLGGEHEGDTETAAASYANHYTVPPSGGFTENRYTVMTPQIGALEFNDIVVPYFSQSMQAHSRHPDTGEILETIDVFDEAVTLPDGSEIGDSDHNNAAVLYQTKQRVGCFRDSDGMNYVENWRFGDQVHPDYPDYPDMWNFSGGESSVSENCLPRGDADRKCHELDGEWPGYRWVGVSSLRHDTNGNTARFYDWQIIEEDVLPNTLYRLQGNLKIELDQGNAAFFVEVLDSSDETIMFYEYDVTHDEVQQMRGTWEYISYTFTTPPNAAKLKILNYSVSIPLHAHYPEELGGGYVPATLIDCGEEGFDDRWFDENGDPVVLYCPTGTAWFADVKVSRAN